MALQTINHGGKNLWLNAKTNTQFKTRVKNQRCLKYLRQIICENYFKSPLENCQSHSLLGKFM